MNNASPLLVISRHWPAVKGGTPAQVAALLNDLRPYLRPLAAALLPARVAVKEDESDVAQLTTLRATTAIRQFHGDTPEQFWAWVVAIQRNEINHTVEKYRAARRSVEREQPLMEEAAVPDKGRPDDDLARREQQDLRAAGLRALRPDDQTVICLRLFERRSFAEVASTMDRECEAAKKLFTRALGHWREACAFIEEDSTIPPP